MKLILFFILLITNIYAKWDFDIIDNNGVSTNVKLSSREQVLNTTVNIDASNFKMDEKFNYAKQFTQFTLNGNLYYFRYEYLYAVATKSDNMDTMEISLPSAFSSFLDIASFKITRNNNDYSKTREYRLSYFTVIQLFDKKYDVYTNTKKVSFYITGVELSTKEIFYTIVKKMTENENKNFNYWLAFGYKKGNFTTYGTAYYAFKIGSLHDLSYKDSSSYITQNRDLNIAGIRFGYKATMNYHIKNNFSFLLEADYSNLNISDKENDRLKNLYPDVKFDEKEINLYASIKYSF